MSITATNATVETVPAVAPTSHLNGLIHEVATSAQDITTRVANFVKKNYGIVFMAASAALNAYWFPSSFLFGAAVGVFYTA